MKQIPTTKALVITIYGVFSLGLAGCNQARQEAKIPHVTVQFENVRSCVDSGYEVVGCELGYRAAIAQYHHEAPKYGYQLECEKDWGPNNCDQLIYSENAVFMPVMAGYILTRSVDEFNANIKKEFYRSDYIWAAPFYSSQSGPSIYLSGEDEKNNLAYIYGEKGPDPERRPSMEMKPIWLNANQLTP